MRFQIEGKTTDIGMCHCSKCPAGLLDEDPGVRVAGHIFARSKAPWDEIAGDAQQLRDGFGSERIR